jgi:hypothetical protein
VEREQVYMTEEQKGISGTIWNSRNGGVGCGDLILPNMGIGYGDGYGNYQRNGTGYANFWGVCSGRGDGLHYDGESKWYFGNVSKGGSAWTTQESD